MTEHQEWFELVAAFADGERVDTRALRAALADETARDYFIDLVAMREMVRDTEHQGAGGGLVTSAVPRPGRTSTQRTERSMTALAAALAMAVGLAGYAIGQQRSQVVFMAVHPPLEADVVVSLEAPPAPTQVIRLEADGTPGAGGR